MEIIEQCVHKPATLNNIWINSGLEDLRLTLPCMIILTVSIVGEDNSAESVPGVSVGEVGGGDSCCC